MTGICSLFTDEDRELNNYPFSKTTFFTKDSLKVESTMSFDELPEEIRIKIWKRFDFETVQKTFTLVSQKWLSTIRNSGELSGQLTLDLKEMIIDEVCNDRLAGLAYEDMPSTKLTRSIGSSWNQLRSLRMNMKLNVSLFTSSSLHKVIFGKNWDKNLIELNNYPWIFISEIWYDPYEKSSRVDRIVREPNLYERAMMLCDSGSPQNISKRSEDTHREKETGQCFFPEIAIQVKIVFFEPELKDYTVDQSLEEVVSKMENLESLYIDIKGNFSGRLDFCVPALQGLKSCSKLKELVVNIDKAYTSERFSFLEALNGTYFPNFTSLKIQGKGIGVLFISDLRKIPQFKNLEELSFKFKNDLGCFRENDNDYEVYFTNPMMKLTHLKIELFDGFTEPEFLINLHKAFPNLGSFTYISNGYFQDGWTIGTLLNVLDSLSKVNTLHISKVCHELEESKEDESPFEVFEAALEIINKKFPKNSTDFKIKTQVTEGEPQLEIIKKKGHAAKLTRKRDYYVRRAKRQKVCDH